MIRGSRLYGLGAGDDKGGIAAMLIAAAILAERPGEAPIVISSHGKGGGSRGSLPVFQRMKESGEGIDRMLYVDYGIIGQTSTAIEQDTALFQQIRMKRRIKKHQVKLLLQGDICCG